MDDFIPFTFEKYQLIIIDTIASGIIQLMMGSHYERKNQQDF